MKVKKGLNIAATICSIVLGSLMIIGAVRLILMLSNYGVSFDYAPDVYIVTILLLLFCIALVIISSLAVNKNKLNGKGLKITMIVFLCILSILEFIGSTSGESAGIIYGILCLIPIGLEIGSLCIKVEPKADVSDEQINMAPEAKETAPKMPRSQSTESKIAELKHLKELKAITDEQYENAIQAIINDLK